ncbi:hypothetical protein JXA70_01000 [candidate division KSB1 bacterium]|nr:hypothetical protein [candidate division KSB1 bacterium]
MKYLSTLIILVVVFRLNAQDSHYWTHKYGTESTLLGGIVVGSHLDISSTFYNPGALGISKNPAFLMTGWVYNLTSFTFESAAGEENDLGALRLSPAPDYIAGLFPTKAKSSKLAYSVLTRYRFQERLFTRDSFRKDVLYHPGDENFSGEYYIDQDVFENWFGFTWSTALSPVLGVGVTNYLAYRSQKQRTSIHSQAFTDLQTAAITSTIRHFNFYNYRLLWKIGLALDMSPLKLGLNVTTPSLSIYGKGTTFLNQAILGQKIPDYSGQDYVQFSEQKETASVFQSPFSIAIGASYKVGKMTLHVSAEWFEEMNTYNVVNGTTITNQTIGIFHDNNVRHCLKAVTNAGLGIQRSFSDRFELYGSFATDFSANSPDSQADITITTWDIYHIMAGLLFRLWRSEVTVGVGASFGQENVLQAVDFNTAHESNLLLGERKKERGTYRNLTFLAGFSIFPSELFQKTLEGFPLFNKKNKSEDQ